MSEVQEFWVTQEDAGLRLDVFLTRHLGDISRSRAQRLIESGAVTALGLTVKPGAVLRGGERIRVVTPDPEPAAPAPQDIPLQIVYEDEDVAVINKPPGLVVHPGAGTPDGTLVNALLGRPGFLSQIGGVFRPGIVHRLDKDTSGLLLVARNDAAHLALSRALARRELTRVYQAIVLRVPAAASGTVDAPIGRHPTVRTRMAVRPDGGRSASTAWRVLERFRHFALIECRLATGRTHQIRVHMAHIGHPVLGDALYGGSAAAALPLAGPHAPRLRAAISRLARRQMLHAWELGFVHPRTAQTVTLRADPPEDFMQLLDALRATP